jgi:hypothetical protein
MNEHQVYRPDPGCFPLSKLIVSSVLSWSFLSSCAFVSDSTANRKWDVNVRVMFESIDIGQNEKPFVVLNRSEEFTYSPRSAPEEGVIFFSTHFFNCLDGVKDGKRIGAVYEDLPGITINCNFAACKLRNTDSESFQLVDTGEVFVDLLPVGTSVINKDVMKSREYFPLYLDKEPEGLRSFIYCWIIKPDPRNPWGKDKILYGSIIMSWKPVKR